MSRKNFLKESNKTNKAIIYPHDALEKRLKEGVFILLQVVAFFLLAAFITYNKGDPGWSSSGNSHAVVNAAGSVGAWLADVMLYSCGYLAYLFPVMIAYGGLLAFHNRQNKISLWLLAIKFFGFVLTILGGCGLAELHLKAVVSSLPNFAGGIFGIVLNEYFTTLLNALGATLLFLTALLVGITLATGLSWLAVASYTVSVIMQVCKFIYFLLKSLVVKGYFKTQLLHQALKAKNLAKEKLLAPLINTEKKAKPSRIMPVMEEDEQDFIPLYTENRSKPRDNDKSRIDESNDCLDYNPTIARRNNKKAHRSTFELAEATNLPSITLLEESLEQLNALQWTKSELAELSRAVESKLKDFGITVVVESVHPGPVITRFELQLAPGIKASKITSLSKDLARSLSVVSVRVVEVIPGKSVVGLEIPNQHREIVRLRDLIESKVYQDFDRPLTLALGKDIAGDAVIVDLAKMPHLLIAGTTGSGKSVGVNAILLSMLYKATPEQLRLILIDPKMLELSIYDGIAHLLTPVVTDMKDAAHSLKWCVAEMERRYQLMATIGVRNVIGYNKKLADAAANGTPLVDPFWRRIEGEEPPVLEELPYIVVIIDEFADMIMVVGKKVEELIARIAQKARAAGIHLILATQRPSVDVITGLIKANVPTRIAFQVSSKIDSRTILDQQGAEQLLGAGDMLYLAPGAGIPQRVHGAFVSDDEVHAVVKALKTNNPEPQYIEDLNTNVASAWHADLLDEDTEQDPLYDEAVFIVTKSRRASVSNLQRRLKIGYNRAARLVEDMEAAGIVSAMQSNGSREILVAEPVED